MLCVAGVSPTANGTTPCITLSMHLTPSQSSSPSPSHTTSRPGSGGSRPSRPGSAASGGGPDATAVASVQLRPSTVWLSLPLLQRLQAFFEPLVGLPAAPAQQQRYDRLHLCCETFGHVVGFEVHFLGFLGHVILGKPACSESMLMTSCRL